MPEFSDFRKAVLVFLSLELNQIASCFCRFHYASIVYLSVSVIFEDWRAYLTGVVEMNKYDLPGCYWSLVCKVCWFYIVPIYCVYLLLRSI
jgi:hypothetical protein